MCTTRERDATKPDEAKKETLGCRVAEFHDWCRCNTPVVACQILLILIFVLPLLDSSRPS